MRKASLDFLYTLTLLLWPATLMSAQSSSQQAPPPQQSQAQPQAPSQTQSQEPQDQKADSIAEAARKAKAKKAATSQGKVLTEDDLAGKKGGLSVVGNENRKTSRRSGAQNGDYDPNGEEYWRGRSQPILDAIADTDARIEQLKEDIKKYGSGGFDVQSGRNTSGKDLDVVYLHDRNGQIQQLEKHKADLKKQLDDLEEEGRKAGAQPAWFR